MKTASIYKAMALLGLAATLVAAKAPRTHGPKGKTQAIQTQVDFYRLKKGETAAKVGRIHGLSLGQLQALNPDLDLGHLAAGTRLRVAPGKDAIPSSGKGLLLASRPGIPAEKAGTMEAAAPKSGLVGPTAGVEALPRTPLPTFGPSPRLERILPTVTLHGEPSAPLNREALGPQLQPVLPPPSSTPVAAAEPPLVPVDPSAIDLLWPVETRTVSSAWGPRMRTRTVRVKSKVSSKSKRIRQRYRGSHKGIDLNAPQGTDVYAALDGQVLKVSRDKGYGNYVVLDHGNGVTTLYAHHSANCVEEGAVVRRGQKIAEVGRTGRATGPHLHFELRVEGQQKNPLPYLNEVEEIPAELVALNQTVAPIRRGR